MSTKSRTIDNLGVDISQRYAKDREYLDSSLIEESKLIPQRTEVSVTTPYVPSEFEEFYSTQQKNLPWAGFFAPPEYSAHRKRLFSYQLIPSMGTFEKQQAELEKLQNIKLPILKKKKKKQKKEQTLFKSPFEKEEEEEDKERKTLIKLLECIAHLDKQLVFVNQRRNQYHKG